MKKIIPKIVRVVFAVFAVYVLCLRTYEIADKVSGKFLGGATVYTVLLGVVFIFAAFVVLILVVHYQDKLRRMVSGITAREMAVILFTVTVVVRLLCAYFIPLDVSMHPDMGTYRHMGTELSNFGQVTASVGYAANYPYTLNYVLFLYPAFKLLGGSLFAVSSYLTLLYAVSLTLFFVTLKEYAGKNISFVGLLIFSFLPSEIFYTQYTVHEHTLVLAGAAVFWLIFKRARFSDRQYVKLLCYLGSLVILSVEFRINKLALVLMIALFIYSFYALLKERVTMKSAAVFCSGFLVVALTFLVTGAALPALHTRLLPPDAKSDRMISAGLWEYYVGLDYTLGGRWTEDSYNDYYKYSDSKLPDYGTKSEREIYKYQEDLLHDRAYEYVKNPFRYITLIAKKGVGMWAEDGLIPISYIKNVNVRAFIADNYIFHLELLFVLFFNLLIALTFVLSIKPKKVADEGPSIYLKMLLIGTTCVLMLVEVAPKYTTAFSLTFVSIAILEYHNAYNHIKAMANHFKRKAENQ